MAKYLTPKYYQGFIYWGGGGKVLPQTPHLPPPKVLNKKFTQSAIRAYIELDQLSDQMLGDIIDKYKYMLLNTCHVWHLARLFPPSPTIPLTTSYALSIE